jgi:hypothetical protein
MKTTHRILAVLSLALSAGISMAAEQGKPIASVEELKTLRHQAVERQRRVIFNNDGNEPVYLCKDTTPEELLKYRTTPLAGSQVDSLFYCTWSSGFSVFTHGTKVGQVFSSKEGLFSKNIAPEMIAAGTDPLRVMAEFGRRNKMEVFWSFRVNDTHDGGLTGYGPIMFRANRLKQEHPEWLIGTPSKKPKFGQWSAVDYTRAEIRDLAFRFVEEVCQNYDVDGVELDFFRHPVFFKRAAMAGAECNDEERGLMTELMLRIREMTETEGMKRGKPILIAIRVPDSVEYCRAIGIDLEHWLKEGMVDLLVTGGYYRLNDWSYSVGLGHKYGVKVYPSFDETRIRDKEARKLRTELGAYRGRALEAWRAGVDGIYLFNSFDPTSPLWRELGSPEVLAPLSRDYFASILGVGSAAGGALPHASFMHIPALNPAAAIAIKPGETAKTTFQSGEDALPKKQGFSETVRLRLRFQAPVTPADLTVELNGTPLAAGMANGPWLEFAVPATQIIGGSNEVKVSLASQASALQWVDLHCAVRSGGQRK